MGADTVFSPRNMYKHPVHYHGDMVRVMFVIISVLLFLTEFVGARLPFTTAGLIGIILVLVIAAGITNPAQKWIHFVNMIVAIGGTMLFGSIAFTRFDIGGDVVAGAGLVTIVAVLFLITLYFATRTVRGQMVPHVDIDQTSL